MKDKMHKEIRVAIPVLLSMLMAATLLVTLPSQALAYSYSVNETRLAVHDDEQVFQLDIMIPNSDINFYLPVNSQPNPERHPYDWAIDWGDGSEQIAQGSTCPDGGIQHTYRLAGDYSITIRPNGSNEAWLSAFGFGQRSVIMYGDESFDDIYSSAALVTGVTSPLKPLMTRTQEQINGIVKPSDYEWSYTFNGCVNLSLAPSFEGWEGIIWAGHYFAAFLFNDCSSLTVLPTDFNLPKDLTSVGSGFAYSMFGNCTSLAALPAGFNLPQDIETSEAGFASYMFYGAGGPNFQINDEFFFPIGVYSHLSDNYYKAFNLSEAAPIQNRTAYSITSKCLVPRYEEYTFDSHFSDLLYVHKNWGGGGVVIFPVGEPGSGDLNGDGIVTMEEAFYVALVAIGYMSFPTAELAAMDMDDDGVITMADVMRVYKIAVG